MSFSILNVGRNGMGAHAFGSHVASQNATNSTTEGYTRRIARLEAIPPPPQGGGGSRAVGSRRVVDPMLERRLLGARSDMGSAEGQMTVLKVLDQSFADGPGDLAEAIAAFEGSIADLASHPNEGGAREAALGSAEALTRAFRRVAGELRDERSRVNESIADEVRTLNERVSKIASLGQEISKAELGGREASDLRDQRDQLIREVSSQVPVKVFEKDNGQVNLLLGGTVSLVDEHGNAHPLEATPNPGSGDIVVRRNLSGVATDVREFLSPGKIGGLFDARDGALQAAQDALDTLAFDMANAYNGVHSAGFGLDGVGGRDLFATTATAPGAAAAFELSADVVGQPDNLAAATAAGTVPGDNRNALALVALADGAVSGGQSVIEGYSALVADVGVSTRSARGEAERSEAALSQVEALRQEISGVSSDEEMVNLMQFQRGYQATVRIVQTADEMLQELINLKR